MTTRGRYTLELTRNNKDKSEIPFFLAPTLSDEKIKKQFSITATKLPLTVIDAFTTDFSSEQELLEYISNNYFATPINISKSSIDITYQHNGKHHLGIALASDSEIKYLSNNSFNSTQIMDRDYVFYLSENYIKRIINNPNFYHHILHERNLSKDLKDKICSCKATYGTTDYNYYIENLVYALISSYKDCRDLIMAANGFNKPVKNLEIKKIIDNPKIEESPYEQLQLIIESPDEPKSPHNEEEWCKILKPNGNIKK